MSDKKAGYGGIWTGSSVGDTGSDGRHHGGVSGRYPGTGHTWGVPGQGIGGREKMRRVKARRRQQQQHGAAKTCVRVRELIRTHERVQNFVTYITGAPALVAAADGRTWLTTLRRSAAVARRGHMPFLGGIARRPAVTAHRDPRASRPTTHKRTHGRAQDTRVAQ